MLDPSLKTLLIETVAASLKSPEIDEIGKMLSKKFDLHVLAEKAVNVTIGTRTAATLLLDYMEDTKKTGDLIKLLAELDNNMILGRTVQLDGLGYFLQQLTLAGYFYDHTKRKVLPLKQDPNELPNWGSLKDGKNYAVSVISVDIVGNSELVKKHGAKKMKKVYTNLWSFLKHTLAHTDGRIWSWAGDGGILAFTFKNHTERAVRFAIEVQRTISLFNIDGNNPLEDPIELRLGIHCGKLVYHNDTGQIISEVINLAAHLEKKQTIPGGISITEPVYKDINSRFQVLFRDTGDFEGTNSYQTERIDQINCSC